MRNVVLLATAAMAFVGAVHAEDLKSRSITLQGHGTLVFNVPSTWVDSTQQASSGLPPTISFAPNSGKPFQVIATPIWPTRANDKPQTHVEMRDTVRKSATEALSQAVETTIEVKSLSGDSSVGYYFAATDRAPKPDEFKYMTQGIVAVGDLRVAFTILTNDGQAAIVQSALTMLSTAKHR